MPKDRAQRLPIDHESGAASLTVIAPCDGAAAVFAAGFPLRQASFARRRDHLLVRVAGCPDVVVPRFFATDAVTTLVTRDGVEVSRHMVLLMLNMSPRMERVLGELAVPGGRDF